ncbi:MAG: DUF1905 domain-containing protein [Lactovum sp.]
MNNKIYEYDEKITAAEQKGGAFVKFPYDIREEFGKGRVKVKATFDQIDYEGSVVNMGIKNDDGTICYIIGIRKDIREKLGKAIGETVRVTIQERE